MKSKVFVSDPSWLDEQLAEWLKTARPTEIMSMTQSASGNTVILTIIYN